MNSAITSIFIFLLLLCGATTFSLADDTLNSDTNNQHSNATLSFINEFNLNQDVIQKVVKEYDLGPDKTKEFIEHLSQPTTNAIQYLLSRNSDQNKDSNFLKNIGMNPEDITKLNQYITNVITKEQLALSSGWGDYKASMMIVTQNDSGEEYTRSIRMSTLEMLGEGDRSLSVFESPPDIRGTALLTQGRLDSHDLQWIYLPKNKRIKRVTLLNKSSPFMGSEFTYEDITPFEIEKYSLVYLGDEKIDEKNRHRVKLTPKSKESFYSKLIAFLDTEHFQPVRIDYYDLEGIHIKSLHLSDYNQYDHRFWRPSTLLMTNQTSLKSTKILWKDYQFNNGLSENDFTKHALQRFIN